MSLYFSINVVVSHDMEDSCAHLEAKTFLEFRLVFEHVNRVLYETEIKRYVTQNDEVFLIIPHTCKKSVIKRNIMKFLITLTSE